MDAVSGCAVSNERRRLKFRFTHEFPRHFVDDRDIRSAVDLEIDRLTVYCNGGEATILTAVDAGNCEDCIGAGELVGAGAVGRRAGTIGDGSLGGASTDDDCCGVLVAVTSTAMVAEALAVTATAVVVNS
ncbi:unnamed protein product [Heligmosomoides polygyrus]|uniref:SHSP domain-containing protein n=1 Tax=Heligmosomoides polygyrus TaxID=6339 RepID=A0A183FAM3_HELPZ|nr:unnamed protein product [Heligmosomoides polygyrus]